MTERVCAQIMAFQEHLKVEATKQLLIDMGGCRTHEHH